jgi:hypothetical protein
VPGQKPIPVQVVAKPTYWQPFLLVAGLAVALLLCVEFTWLRPLVGLVALALAVLSAESPNRL